MQNAKIQTRFETKKSLNTCIHTPFIHTFPQNVALTIYNTPTPHPINLVTCPPDTDRRVALKSHHPSYHDRRSNGTSTKLARLSSMREGITCVFLYAAEQQQKQRRRCRNNAVTLVPEPKYTLGVHDLNKMRCPPGRK